MYGDGDVEFGGGVGVGQFLKVVHFNALTHLFRQGVYGRPHKLREFPPEDRVGVVAGEGDGIEHIEEMIFPVYGQPGLSAGDGEQPGGETVQVLEAGQRNESINKSFLDKVQSSVAVVDLFVNKGEERPFVTLDKFAEGFFLPGHCPPN